MIILWLSFSSFFQLKLEMLSQRIGLMEYNDKIILPRIQKVTFVGLQKNPGNQLYVDNVQLGTEFFDYDVTNRVSFHFLFFLIVYASRQTHKA